MMRGRGRPTVLGGAACALAAVSLAALSLSGCSGPPAPTAASPSPTATTVFASEEEALAAATEAYAAYQAALDIAYSTYDVSQLMNLATKAEVDGVRESVAEWEAEKKRQVGTTGTHGVRLVGDITDVIRSGNTQIYVCLDVVGIDVVDENGASVVDDSQIDTYPMIASLDWSTSGSRLIVAGEDVWTAENFCV